MSPSPCCTFCSRSAWKGPPSTLPLSIEGSSFSPPAAPSSSSGPRMCCEMRWREPWRPSGHPTLRLRRPTSAASSSSRGFAQIVDIVAPLPSFLCSLCCHLNSKEPRALNPSVESFRKEAPSWELSRMRAPLSTVGPPPGPNYRGGMVVSLRILLSIFKQVP